MAESYLLQRGDIIRLEKGMTVYASIPQKFIYANTPFSDQNDKTAICIGQVLRKTVTTRDKIIKYLTMDVESRLHREIPHKQVSDFVNSLNLDFTPEEFDTSIFAGEYCVYQTCSDGGGVCGSLNGVDSYPNGWHVYCVTVGNPQMIVDFYQTGCFSAMIPDIKPIRRED